MPISWNNSDRRFFFKGNSENISFNLGGILSPISSRNNGDSNGTRKGTQEIA